MCIEGLIILIFIIALKHNYCKIDCKFYFKEINLQVQCQFNITLDSIEAELIKYVYNNAINNCLEATSTRWQLSPSRIWMAKGLVKQFEMCETLRAVSRGGNGLSGSYLTPSKFRIGPLIFDQNEKLLSTIKILKEKVKEFAENLKFFYDFWKLPISPFYMFL